MRSNRARYSCKPVKEGFLNRCLKWIIKIIQKLINKIKG